MQTKNRVLAREHHIITCWAERRPLLVNYNELVVQMVRTRKQRISRCRLKLVGLVNYSDNMTNIINNERNNGLSLLKKEKYLHINGDLNRIQMSKLWVIEHGLDIVSDAFVTKKDAEDYCKDFVNGGKVVNLQQHLECLDNSW